MKATIEIECETLGTLVLNISQLCDDFKIQAAKHHTGLNDPFPAIEWVASTLTGTRSVKIQLT